MENKNRVEDLIDEYLISSELDEGKKLDRVLDLSRIIGRGTKKGIKGVVWMLEKSFDGIARHIANSIEASAHITSLDKISKIKSHDKKIELLNRKVDGYKKSFVNVLMELENELQKKNKIISN